MFPMIHGILSGAGVELDPDYAIYEAAMSTPPTTAWRTAVNQMVLDIKAALAITNLSDAFDCMWFLAAETEQASRLNMVKRAHDCTATVSPTFEASRGIASNGTTSYLNTNWNAATQGVTYTLNSASFGVYSRTDANTTAVVLGWTNGTQTCYIRPRQSGLMRSSINRNNESTGAVANSLGLFVANRSTSTQANGYKNGVSVTNDIANSTSLASLNAYICAHNGNGTASFFDTRQLAFAFTGSSMTADEHAAFYTAVQAAMTAIGANV